jgi:inhibitor of cysteine peptidase
MLHALDELKKWLVALFVIVLLTGGCSPTQVQINQAHNGVQKELTRGQILLVTLDSNPTTGYSWQVAEVNPAVLRQSGDAEYKPQSASDPPRVGAGGTETFRFEAANAGATTLKLVYQRPWEKDVAPLLTYTVQVTVR